MSQLQYDTPSKDIWQKIKAMKSTCTVQSFLVIDQNSLITDPTEIANSLGKVFVEMSKLETTSEPNCMNESIDRAKNEINNEPYNREFSLIELERVLMTLKNTAPGIDEISNALLKQLPTNIKQELLDVVNQSYISGDIPIEWKTGLVVPILKPGKPPESASSYRPIILLACIGKVMERMVQKSGICSRREGLDA